MVSITHGGDDLAGLAMALAEEGILIDADLDGATHLLPPIGKACQRWMASISEGLRFKVGLVFTDDWPDHLADMIGEFGVPDEKEMERLRECKMAMTLMLSTDCSDNCVVGPRCTDLELLHPGLGAAVLGTLTTAFNQTIGTFGPWEATGTVQNLHWMGELDHTLRLEEMQEGNYENVDYLAPFEIDAGHGAICLVLEWQHGAGAVHHQSVTWEIPQDVTSVWIDALDFSEWMISKQDFHAALPEWACKYPKRTRFTPLRLRALAGTIKRKDLRYAVIAAAELEEAMRAANLRSDAKNFYAIENSPTPIILSWNDGQDMVCRMYDDFTQQALESSEATPVRNVWIFPQYSMKSARAALRQVDSTIKLLHVIAKALMALSTKTYFS